MISQRMHYYYSIIILKGKTNPKRILLRTRQPKTRKNKNIPKTQGSKGLWGIEHTHTTKEKEMLLFPVDSPIFCCKL
jgi:hypothetical protein